jgi:hypothetical protein
LAVERINAYDFLSLEEKADIFYNNAARFLRLSEETIARHHATASQPGGRRRLSSRSNKTQCTVAIDRKGR